MPTSSDPLPCGPPREARTPTFPVMGMAKPNLHRELLPLAGSFDFIVIDGPPRQHEVLRSAIVASDLVLMPVKASSFDVWAVQGRG